jgi:DGQHR domain-containing protein
LPIEDQAMLFATINLKQTKVSPSLVFDLFEETKLRSPQKTCHNICKAMNTDAQSPFFHRLKPLGKKTLDYSGILTQATFVKRLLPHVSNYPDKVRDNVKRRIPLSASDSENSDCIFWKYFVDEKDWAILKILMNYFNAVKDQFGGDWNSDVSPLPRSIGFSALMKLLPVLFKKGQAQNTFEQSFFVSEFEKARPLAPFTFDHYPASGVGESRLYQSIAEKLSAQSG